MQHCIWFVHFLHRYDAAAAAALDAPLLCAKSTESIDIVLLCAERSDKFASFF